MQKNQVISNYKDVEKKSQRAMIGASIQTSCERQESNYSNSNNCLWMTRYYLEDDSNQEIHFVIDTENPCQ